MIWFISACLFFLFREFFSDFAGILSLGFFLPILLFLENRSGYNLREGHGIDRSFVFYFFIITAISFLMGAMPQDFLNSMALGILGYSIYRLERHAIPVLSYVALPFLSWMFFWFMGGDGAELIFLSLFLAIFISGYRILSLYSVGIHLAFFLVYIFLFPWDVFFVRDKIDGISENLFFLSALPLFLGSLSLFFNFLSNYYNTKALLVRTPTLVVFFTINFLFLDPFFSVFLYFSSLHVNRPSERIVERGGDFAS